MNEPIVRQHCGHPIFDSRQRAWLEAAQAVLREIEKVPLPEGPFKASLRIEAMIGEVRAMSWGMNGCQAIVVVDPWGLSPRTKTCSRQAVALEADSAMQMALHCLVPLFETLTLIWSDNIFCRNFLAHVTMTRVHENNMLWGILKPVEVRCRSVGQPVGHQTPGSARHIVCSGRFQQGPAESCGRPRTSFGIVGQA